MSLSLITVNIGAPSPARARRQLKWLAERPEDIFVLTETKATPGRELLAEGCTAANYSVIFPTHDPGELSVMIVSKVATTPGPLTGALGYLPARAAGVIVNTSDGPLRVLGAYVPSRDATLEKTERKKRWIEGFHTALEATQSGVPVLLLGDLNVLEPGHQPEHRQQFAPFEYDFYRALTDTHGPRFAFGGLAAPLVGIGGADNAVPLGLVAVISAALAVTAYATTIRRAPIACSIPAQRARAACWRTARPAGPGRHLPRGSADTPPWPAAPPADGCPGGGAAVCPRRRPAQRIQLRVPLALANVQQRVQHCLLLLGQQAVQGLPQPRRTAPSARPRSSMPGPRSTRPARPRPR